MKDITAYALVNTKDKSFYYMPNELNHETTDYIFSMTYELALEKLEYVHSETNDSVEIVPIKVRKEK